MVKVPLVSVVVPIYNVEQYLEECVMSILKQTVRNIEVILVDDGSPDGSGHLSDELAERDKRIRVVHQENQGLGPARNTGLSLAKGEYVMFVDSDDWIDEDMVERLLETVRETDADAAFSGYRVMRRGAVDYESRHPLAGSILEGEEQIWKLRRAFFGAYPNRNVSDNTPVSVCFSMYRLDLIRERNIAFWNVRSEDRFFNAEFCKSANTIAVSDSVFYNYRNDRQPSITNGFNDSSIQDNEQLFDLLFRMGSQETQRKEEAILRIKRSVIDCTRALLMSLESCEMPTSEKVELAGSLLHSKMLRRAVEDFPFTALPVQQQAFYLAEFFMLPKTALALASIRNRKR